LTRSTRRNSGSLPGVAALLLVLGGCASTPAALTADEARQQVAETELAFARTMANRDLTAFGAYLADDTVFLDGDKALRGRQAVLDAWAPLFHGPDAPFSWAPDRIEISGGNTLGYTSGPVLRGNGQPTGRFNSVWQRQRDGSWRIVFDAGSD
jgi:ketosteroid isomerase-like protein